MDVRVGQCDASKFTLNVLPVDDTTCRDKWQIEVLVSDLVDDCKFTVVKVYISDKKWETKDI